MNGTEIVRRLQERFGWPLEISQDKLAEALAEIPARPLVTDLPRLRYTDAHNCRLIHHVSIAGGGNCVDVVGDLDNGGYEWVKRDDNGKIIAHSNEGYGSPAYALRDGLNAAIPA